MRHSCTVQRLVTLLCQATQKAFVVLRAACMHQLINKFPVDWDLDLRCWVQYQGCQV